MHLHFRYLGIYLESEIRTSDGRMDAVMKTPTHVYILEFMINESGEAAFAQIREKGYADKFKAISPEKTLVGMGISLDTGSGKL